LTFRGTHEAVNSGTVRTVAIIAASLIGLSGVGAFASNAYHHRPAAGASGSHTPNGGTPAPVLDNTVAGDSSAAGSYCPIPPRGHAEKRQVATTTQSAGDSLFLTGQSVAPDTASGLCTGTAVPAKRP
jgi:hypothetical protein